MDIPRHLKSFVRSACMADIDCLAPVLREDDMRDIQEISQFSPYEALLHGYRHSLVCIVFHRHHNTHDVVGMGGVLPDGIVWTLFHKDFLKNKKDKRDFIRACRPVLSWFLSVSPTGALHNVTLSVNKKILKWLQWLGAGFSLTKNNNITHFTFTSKEPYHV